ncbi:MAG: cold shock domain-containing protein [Halioglobus sp.]|nr:cold shock domain-containing protein [Halioglobus sp.]
MSVTVKILIALLIAAITASIVTTLQTGSLFNLAIWSAFAAACVASVLLGTLSTAPAGAIRDNPADADTSQRKAPGATATGQREHGKVKWFNISKGFGFIVRDNGEEIFVHFRSIQSNGRRGLRDGQAVSFVVRQSDKGPQAEEVIASDNA